MERYNFSDDEQYLLRKNLVGATNFEELEKAEQFVFTVRALQFEQGDYVIINYSENSLVALHFHLFQDIYKFAGEFRDVQLVKGETRFYQMQFIQSELERIFSELTKEPAWSTIDEAATRLAYFKSELNIIHPFREGNGRTIRLFIQALARSQGYEWHYSNMDQTTYMNAMIRSVYNTQLLEQLFKETLVKIQ